MSAPEHRYTISPTFLLLLASLLAFIAAFTVAEGWLTKGTWQEWVAAGLALHVLGELA
jgi:hypothetical protein